MPPETADAPALRPTSRRSPAKKKKAKARDAPDAAPAQASTSAPQPPPAVAVASPAAAKQPEAGPSKLVNDAPTPSTDTITSKPKPKKKRAFKPKRKAGKEPARDDGGGDDGGEAPPTPQPRPVLMTRDSSQDSTEASSAQEHILIVPPKDVAKTSVRPSNRQSTTTSRTRRRLTNGIERSTQTEAEGSDSSPSPPEPSPASSEANHSSVDAPAPPSPQVAAAASSSSELPYPPPLTDMQAISAWGVQNPPVWNVPCWHHSYSGTCPYGDRCSYSHAFGPRANPAAQSAPGDSLRMVPSQVAASTSAPEQARPPVAGPSVQPRANVGDQRRGFPEAAPRPPALADAGKALLSFAQGGPAPRRPGQQAAADGYPARAPQRVWPDAAARQAAHDEAARTVLPRGSPLPVSVAGQNSQAGPSRLQPAHQSASNAPTSGSRQPPWNSRQQLLSSATATSSTARPIPSNRDQRQPPQLTGVQQQAPVQVTIASVRDEPQPQVTPSRGPRRAEGPMPSQRPLPAHRQNGTVNRLAGPSNNHNAAAIAGPSTNRPAADQPQLGPNSDWESPGLQATNALLAEIRKGKEAQRPAVAPASGKAKAPQPPAQGAQEFHPRPPHRVVERPTCGICWDIPEEYGLLPNCSHAFCMACIREWRDGKGKDQALRESGVTKLCPACRTHSPFVVPSFVFLENGPRKEQRMKQWIERRAAMPCKHFEETKRRADGPFCPFGDECHHKHELTPGDARYLFGTGHEGMQLRRELEMQDRLTTHRGRGHHGLFGLVMYANDSLPGVERARAVRRPPPVVPRPLDWETPSRLQPLVRPSERQRDRVYPRTSTGPNSGRIEYRDFDLWAPDYADDEHDDLLFDTASLGDGAMEDADFHRGRGADGGRREVGGRQQQGGRRVGQGGRPPAVANSSSSSSSRARRSGGARQGGRANQRGTISNGGEPTTTGQLREMRHALRSIARAFELAHFGAGELEDELIAGTGGWDVFDDVAEYREGLTGELDYGEPSEDDEGEPSLQQLQGARERLGYLGASDDEGSASHRDRDLDDDFDRWADEYGEEEVDLGDDVFGLRRAFERGYEAAAYGGDSEEEEEMEGEDEDEDGGQISHEELRPRGTTIAPLTPTRSSSVNDASSLRGSALVDVEHREMMRRLEQLAPFHDSDETQRGDEERSESEGNGETTLRETSDDVFIDEQPVSGGALSRERLGIEVGWAGRRRFDDEEEERGTTRVGSDLRDQYFSSSPAATRGASSFHRSGAPSPPSSWGHSDIEELQDGEEYSDVEEQEDGEGIQDAGEHLSFEHHGDVEHQDELQDLDERSEGDELSDVDVPHLDELQGTEELQDLDGYQDLDAHQDLGEHSDAQELQPVQELHLEDVEELQQALIQESGGDAEQPQDAVVSDQSCDPEQHDSPDEDAAPDKHEGDSGVVYDDEEEPGASYEDYGGDYDYDDGDQGAEYDDDDYEDAAEEDWGEW